MEQEGVPTTQISLVRPHTRTIQPPRALWVPFELGRPLGAPGDPAFQTRVLRAALALLEAEQGPVLADFEEEAPEEAQATESAGWSCPVPLPPAPAGEEDLGTAFQRELERMLPWYALAVEQRGRTTVGLSGLEPQELGSFLREMLEPPLPESPIPDTPLGMALKHAAEDLKALYQEAAQVRPGGAGDPQARAPGAERAGESSSAAPADAVRRWFWRETRAGELLKALRARHAESEDPALGLVARLMLVPHQEV